MDISSSLNSCKNIIETLKNLPKHKRYPLTVQWYPKRTLENAHSEMLRKCIPFINKIIKDSKNSLSSFEKCSLAEIESRKAYIQNKLEEAKQKKEAQTKRNKIISEIEKLGKMNIPKVQKVVFSEKESNLIIKYLFENEINSETSPSNDIGDFITLTYDKDANNKTNAYDKILQLF